MAKQWVSSQMAIIATAALFLAYATMPSATAWVPNHKAMRGTSLCMISNLFPSQKPTASELPRDVKEAVSKCRASVQEALKERISRMEIEFPVGTKFGVEKAPKKKGRKRASMEDDSSPSRTDLARSDRELARLFVDMFQPVGGQNIAVIFNDVEGADAAKKRWKDDLTAVSNILSLDRNRKSLTAAKKKKKKQIKARGFAAKLAAEVGDGNSNSNESGPFQLPENTEVALFVQPGPKELIIVERICNAVGQDTLVILLNARTSRLEGTFASDQTRQLFQDEFSSIFVLDAAPKVTGETALPNVPAGLLYRAFPDEWVLARKPAVGPPKAVGEAMSERPTAEQCQAALSAVELSDVEQGVENVMENVAGWFR